MIRSFSLSSIFQFAVIALSGLLLLAACGGGTKAVIPDRIITGIANLTPGQQVPTVVSAASGVGAVVVDSITKVITGGIARSDVVGPTFAHIHIGAAGMNGDVVLTLDRSTVASGVWSIPPTTLKQVEYDAFLENRLYFNIHSTSNRNGDIRGQITKN